MIKPRRRDRAKGRYQSGEYFARLPAEVLGSVAYRSLPDFAKVCLIALAGQYRGKGNGDLSLTWSEAHDLGVSTEWKLRAGIRLLDTVGLLEITRPGGNVAGGEKIPTLYALGWLSIPQSEKFESPPGSLLKPLNRWATWNRPDDWSEQIETARRHAQGKLKRHHTREEQVATHGRSDNGKCHVTREEQGKPFIATHGGESSRDIGVRPDVAALKLIESQPHLTDFDIAKALKWKIEPGKVQSLRHNGAR